MITYFAIIMNFTYCFPIDQLRLHKSSAPPGSSPAGEVIQTLKQDCETIAELKAFDSWEEACKAATDRRVWRLTIPTEVDIKACCEKAYVMKHYQQSCIDSGGYIGCENEPMKLTRMRCEPEPKFRLVEDN